jgi:hypothetical protein
MDMLMDSSGFFRKNSTNYLIDMAYMKSIGKGLLGTNKMMICLWLVMLLLMSSGRKTFNLHGSI